MTDREALGKIILVILKPNNPAYHEILFSNFTESQKNELVVDLIIKEYEKLKNKGFVIAKWLVIASVSAILVFFLSAVILGIVRIWKNIL